MNHHGNERTLSPFFIALCIFLSLSLSLSFLACSFEREKFIHDEGDGAVVGDAQGQGFTLTFDLNASDATWAGEKTLRVAKNTYVKNPAGSPAQQGQGQGQGQSQSQGPMRKGYVFTGWYTEAGEANQNQATRFKFEDEAGVTPNTVTSDITLYAGWGPATLEGVVKLGKLPSDLSLYDEVTQAALGAYKSEAMAGASVSAIFVTLNGGSDANKRDGASWETAWAGSQLKEKLDGIKDASASKVYLFLVAAGEYRAGADSEILKGRDDTRGRDISYWLAMKDDVAIVGGWDGTGGGGSWKRGPAYVTNFKGGKAKDEAQSKQYSVFYNKNLRDKAALAYATVSDGSASGRDGSGLVTGRGGGMYNANSSPVLTNVTFSGNSAGGFGGGEGGGMYNFSSSPVLMSVIFSGNLANGDGGGGGGMYNDNSSPVLTSVTFSGNSGSSHNNGGGGMYNKNSSPMLTNVTFSDNKASGGGVGGGVGGGMYNKNSSPMLTNVTFSRNIAFAGGGGMYNDNSSPMLTNVTFWDNSADYLGGGGMYNKNSSPVLTSVTFSSNSASNDGISFVSGGGMYNYSSSPVLMNVTFSGNSVSSRGGGNGGGMYNDNNGKAPTVVNSLFWGNTVTEGSQTESSQIHLSNGKPDGPENINLYNCIVQGGLGVSGTASTPLPNPLTLVALSTTPPTLTDQTRFGGISVKSTKEAEGAAPVTITYENVYGAIDSDNPSLSTLGSYGGSVQTIPIAEGSFPIDKGLYLRRLGASVYYSYDNSSWFTRDIPTQRTPAPLPSEAIDVTATDARGYRRVGKPDIGAYEFGGLAP